LQKELDVEPFDNQGTLYNRVMFKSMEYFIEVLDLVMGGCVGIDQIGEGSYYKRGCPYDGLINAEWDSLYIKRFIRAMIYPPYSPAKFQQNNVLTFSDYLNLKRKIEKE
jgi:methionyl-tRNA formyltransferase